MEDMKNEGLRPETPGEDMDIIAEVSEKAASPRRQVVADDALPKTVSAPKASSRPRAARQIPSKSAHTTQTPAPRPVAPAPHPIAADGHLPKPVRTPSLVPPPSRSATPAQPRFATPAQPRPATPAQPRPATPAQPRPATPAQPRPAAPTQHTVPVAPAGAPRAASKTLKKITNSTEIREAKTPSNDRGGVTSGIVKALIYIAFVLIVSGFLAIYGIRVANDVFAFVKDEVEVEVVVPENATLTEVSDILYSNGLIEDASWFRMYMGFKYRGKDLSFVPGPHTVSSTMNYKAIIAELTPSGAKRQILTITIPEGYTVDEIIDLLVGKGIGTREGFVDAIQNYPFSYKFLDVLASVELSSARKYRLEGYLFPDTYDFYSDSSETAVIDKMLANFDYRFEEAYYDRLTSLNMNLDEVMTLASMIQEEAHYSEDMYYISAVFHNRLDNPGSYPFLNSDATVQYALPEHKAELTAADLQLNSPYNSYLYKGLPPSAISNPGLDAISAALYPEDKLEPEYGTKSYYFIADTDGHTLFASTAAGHQKNLEKVAADKAALAAASGN